MFRHVWLWSILIVALAAAGCSRKAEQQQSSAATSQQPEQAAPAQTPPAPAQTAQPETAPPQQAAAPAPEPARRPSAMSEKAAPAKPKRRKPVQTTETAQNVQSANGGGLQTPVPAPPAVPAEPTPPPPQPAMVRLEVPTGTAVSVRMIDGIDSSKDQPGQQFHATLNQPIQSGDRTVVPSGADVYIRLANAKSAGHIKGQSELELQLARLVYNGRTYPLTSNSYTATGASRGKQTAKRSVIGGGVGAAIGAIAGGGKGAAIGAAVGGGGAAAYQLATRGPEVKVPSETVLQFTLQAPLVVTRSARPGQEETTVRTDEPPPAGEQPVSPK